MSKYLIQVLDSKSFEDLPYKYVHRAVGVTDTKDKKIYIRNMGNTSLNHDVIEHEIDEASNNFHGHESPDEYGIKYGFFSKIGRSLQKTFFGKYIVPAALGLIPGVGPALAATYGGVNAYQKQGTAGSAIGGALSGLAAGGAGKAIAGATGFGTGGVTGLAGAKAGIGKYVSAIPGMGEGGAIKKAISGVLPGFGGGATSGATGTATATGAGTGAVAPNAAGPVTMGQTGALPSIGQTAAGTVGNKSLLKTLGGFGISALGNQLVGTPEMPDSAKVAGLEGRLQEGGGQVTDIGGLGVEKLTERLGTPWTGLPDDYKAAIKADFDQPYQDAKDNLIRQYKSLRPGADISNDSAFRKDMARLEESFADDISNKMVKLEQEERNNYLNRQATDIQQSLNIDQNTFNQYAQIAQYDAAKIMTQYGIDYQTAKDFKAIFGEYGGMLMQQGLGMG